MEKIKISICIITQGNYWQSRYCIENLLSKIGDLQVELLILDNGSKDTRIVDFCKKIASLHIIESEPIGLAAAYNKIFINVKGDFVCVFPLNILVGEGWLHDLIFHGELINRSGISAISSSYSECKLLPLLDKDEGMTLVWWKEDNIVDGVYLFNSRLLNSVGGLDEKMAVSNFELKQFAFRVASSGYSNYYITQQSCVKLSDFQIGERVNKKFQENICELKRNRNFNAPLIETE